VSFEVELTDKLFDEYEFVVELPPAAVRAIDVLCWAYCDAAAARLEAEHERRLLALSARV
jgi:hypothetical protein